MAQKSKNKGNTFERKVAGLLDKWWLVESKTFWRTTQSGGWVEPGDVAPRIRFQQDPVWFPFIVECKFHKYLEFMSLFKDTKTQQLESWWGQISVDKEKAIFQGRHKLDSNRLVFIKRNAMPILIMYDLSEINNITRIRDEIPIYVNIHTEKINVYITTWDIFSSTITKEALMNWKPYREALGRDG